MSEWYLRGGAVFDVMGFHFHFPTGRWGCWLDLVLSLLRGWIGEGGPLWSKQFIRMMRSLSGSKRFQLVWVGVTSVFSPLFFGLVTSRSDVMSDAIVLPCRVAFVSFLCMLPVVLPCLSSLVRHCAAYGGPLCDVAP